MPICFKDYKVMKQCMLVTHHPKLIALNMWFVVRYSNPTMTSSYRKNKIHPEDSGIHCTIPLRATDWRSRDYPEPEKIAEDINKHWSYDPQRPELKCCIYHDTGRGFHFHLQVHERTEYKP